MDRRQEPPGGRRAGRVRLASVLASGLVAFGSATAAGQSADPPVEPPPMAAGESAIADAAPPAPNPYAGDLFTRLRMTGDWGGTRSAMAERGLTYDLFATQFYQGVASGGRNREWEYGGKINYLLNADSGKMGLWQGGFLNFLAETRYGTSVNNIDGLIAPSNIAMQFPTPDGSVTSITGLKLTQALSENFAVYAGKINTLSEYAFKYSPGLGTNLPGLEGFMNTSLVFNPILARTVPYSAAGAGGVVLRGGRPLLAVTVFDPEERATKGLENLFSTGAVVVSDLFVEAEPFGRPGRYNVGGSYSNAKYTSTEPTAYLVVPLGEGAAPVESGSWSLYANFYQAFVVDDEDEKKNWGLFGQFGLSDGNPNPIRYVANGGIGGRSMIPGRTYDTFGVGYFYLGLSEQFKALTSVRIPQRDEYGVELFYNLAVTPWCRLSTDLQVARPSTFGFDTAIIPGLRLQLLF